MSRLYCERSVLDMIKSSVSDGIYVVLCQDRDLRGKGDLGQAKISCSRRNRLLGIRRFLELGEVAVSQTCQESWISSSGKFLLCHKSLSARK